MSKASRKTTRGKRALLAAACLVLAAGAASAADLAPMGGPSWTGFYFGGYLGAGGVVSKVTTPLLPGASFDGVGGEGLLGGILAGFNYQISPQIVMGLQGEFGFSGMSTTLNLAPLPVSASGKSRYSASLSGRLGWLSNPDTLLYVIGGYTHSRAKVRLTIGGTSVSRSQGYDGFHIGTGMETRLSDAITARIEYRYTHYGKEDWGTGGLVNVAPSSHTGTIGIVWNLGMGETASPAADLAPPERGWPGFYLGGYLGGGAAVTRVTSPLLPGASFDGLGGEGIHGGLFAGYNYQFSPSLVAGLQGEFGLTDISTDLKVPSVPLTASLRPDYTLGISGRLGWLANSDTLLYVIGGYTHAWTKGKINLAGLAFSRKQGFDGFHVGAGMETRLTETITARVEYRFTQYGKEALKGTGGLVSVAPSSHKGMIGLAWNF